MSRWVIFDQPRPCALATAIASVTAIVRMDFSPCALLRSPVSSLITRQCCENGMRAAASRAARDSFDLQSRTRLGFEKVRGGAWLSVFRYRFRRFVAWIERSAIRERRFGSAAPGFAALNPGYEKMKEAERRQTLGSNRRILRCGARPFGARTLDGVPPRLSSRGVFHPQGQLQARLPGTWSERALPAFACPSPGMHLPPRS